MRRKCRRRSVDRRRRRRRPANRVIDRIQKRARRVSLSTPPELLNALDRYLQLLARWNAKINLTAFRLEEPSDEAIDRLLIEPLVAARHLPHGKFSLIDVGSGSGSPGIPLRLAAPAASLDVGGVEDEKGRVPLRGCASPRAATARSSKPCGSSSFSRDLNSTKRSMCCRFAPCASSPGRSSRSRLS